MAIVPADVMFGIDDVEDQGLYSTPFVYIHCRGEFKLGSSLDMWCHELIEGIASVGLDPELGKKLKGWIGDAGFIPIIHKFLLIPIGTLPKDKILKENGAFKVVKSVKGLEAISLYREPALQLDCRKGFDRYSAQEVYIHIEFFLLVKERYCEAGLALAWKVIDSAQMWPADRPQIAEVDGEVRKCANLPFTDFHEYYVETNQSLLSCYGK
ncbi:hypothetical protein MPH_02998 [Macrophomina phaseolina MS6]|uniref:Uncharacterized protein n=1 Tax=Macrophomina phaseolina (strain MS6) TaxID=1126212 RepID=K2S3S9_MACPH|nr:hypothetical protein MPH_02998 [Macrophomina phaseolina MS6]